MRPLLLMRQLLGVRRSVGALACGDAAYQREETIQALA